MSTLVHLRSLASPTDSLNLLPALRSLVWVETDPCMLHSDIAPFLRSSQLVSVSLHIENKNHEYATREHKVFCRDALLRLLCTVSSTSPSLGRLTIQAPPSIPLSGSLFRGFDCVLHANLRMCIGGMSLDMASSCSLLTVEFSAVAVRYGRLAHQTSAGNPRTDGLELDYGEQRTRGGRPHITYKPTPSFYQFYRRHSGYPIPRRHAGSHRFNKHPPHDDRDHVPYSTARPRR